MEKASQKGRPKKNEKELKLKTVKFRMTFTEYIELIKNKPSHLRDSDYFRTLIKEKKPDFFDYNKMNNNLFEIKKIGINLNQITKKINSFGEIDLQSHYELTEKILELNKIYFNILNEINSK